MPKSLLIGLVVLVAVAWATNLTIGYLGIAETEPSVNAIFMMILGALFPAVRKMIRGSKNGGDGAP
ncbi:hypothetical protein DMH04_41265 [Kibdelosporangium aridum]|uniref:Uncharacterized protein n=1 Tax=Kibdelosporangium aridum TaxID=2030 RepID=A0A428YUR8_KIBAR|nr:hypothetical protein [Kibdelosporangium aridum]RSM73444.1 hypothetical protein DMH04_41265 [Kibdelosporangium aridum]